MVNLRMNPVRRLVHASLFWAVFSILGTAAQSYAIGAFNYRKQITIDAGQVTGTSDFTDYPVLISLTDLDLRTTASGGHVEHPNGYDIVFRAADGITRLDFELESYDGAAGTVVAWVRIPVLSYNVDTILYMYYGNDQIACSQEKAASVWDSNYNGVWHLEETSGTQFDSTTNDADGVTQGTITQDVAGRIAGGDQFEGPGSVSWIEVADQMFPANSPFTLEAWVYPFSVRPADWVGLVTKGRTGADPYWVGLWSSPNNLLSFGWGWDVGQSGNLTSTTVLTPGQWHHVVAVFDGSSQYLYYNGDPDPGSAPQANFYADIPELSRIGGAANTQYLDGWMDEVRISRVARSADWILTGYNNMNSPGTFFSVGVEESGPYSWPLAVNFRSIGTSPGTLYDVGNASIGIGSTTVNFGGAASLPTNIGRGDELVIGVDTLYILDRVSATQVTVQEAATADHTNESYTISRAYNTLQAWETAREGDLVAQDRNEVGVIYNDGAFATGVAIDGSTTNCHCFMRLTVAEGQRHNGTAAVGAVLDGSGTDQGIRIEDDYTALEWLSFKRIRGVASAASVVIQSATDVLLTKLLIYDFADPANLVAGIRAQADAGYTVRNSIIYDGDRAGIRNNDATATGVVENCTIYGMDPSGTGVGVLASAGTLTVTNTISMGNSVSGDFNGAMSQSYNMSSDLTAVGTGSLSGMAASNQFVSVSAGTEDLHLKPGADALDVATNLSSSSFPFTDDIDGQTRSASWDMGADELVATPLYRSVGITATDLNTDSRTVTISGSTATFSGPMRDNVGVGDALTYDSGGNRLAFIHGRTSSTEFTVKDKNGGTPTAASAGSSVGVYRAYTSLSNWASQTENANITEPTENDVNPSTDLVTTFTVMMVACYADGTDTVEPVIDGWTTGPSNYIKIFTPTSTKEVGTSQRHNGTAGTGYRLSTSSPEDGILISDEYVRIEGLEISAYYDGIWINAIGTNNEIRISHCLIHDCSFASASGIWPDDPDAVVYIWNNIIYNLPASGSGIESTNASEIYVYNNTISDCGNYGINIISGVCTAKNNLVANSGVGNYEAGGAGSFHSSSDYNWSDDTTDPGGTNDINSSDGGWSDVTFVDEAGDDFHLDSSDAGAKDNGTDLSSDPNLPFTLDIDGGRRQTPWDIGADDILATTAVELITFMATGHDGEVWLQWETGSEVNNLGFHLYRSSFEEGPYSQITSRLIPGLGSSPEGARYAYRDTGLTNGVTYYYKLEDVETTGKTEMHGPVSATPAEGAGTCCGGGEVEGIEESRITVGDPSSNEFRVLENRPGEVILELLTGGFYAEPSEDGMVRLEIPGFSLTEEEGFPRLPVKRSWVPIVAGRSVKVVSVETFEEEVFDHLRPENAGASVVEAGRRTVRIRRAPRPAVAKASARLRLYPEQSAQLLETAFQEEVKKVRVELAPLRWDGNRQRLVLAHRLVVRLSLAGRDRAERSRDGFRGRRYRRRRSHEPRRVVARLVTKQAGLYGVGFEELFSGRRAQPSRADSLRLSRQGETVPFHLEGSVFGPGSTLYFVSEGAAANPYGHEAVYELEAGVEGERMAVRSAVPSGEPTPYYWERVEKEEEHLYQATLADAPDRWLWSALYAPSRESFSFEVSELAATAESSLLTVWLQGGSDFPADPDHHVRLYVNGVFVGETSWNSKKAQRMDTEIGPGTLRDGENRLEIESVNDTEATYSMVMVDRYEVSYPRRLRARDGRLEGFWSTSGTAEITGVTESIVIEKAGDELTWLEGVETTLAGVRFRAEADRVYIAVSPEAVLKVAEVRTPPPSRLKDTSHRADYVMIGPRAFVSSAEALMELRRSQGLRAKAVAVEDVFSEFGFGEENPKAIQDFLSYAYHQWAVGPRYVLLLGDGTYDFKDYLGTGVVNRVPPLMVMTRYLETASDPAYAAVNGDDLLPDLAIGRLPAATVDELETMVAKIVAFETSGGSLEGRAVLITDNPDNAGDFVQNAENLAATVLSTREPETIYLSELGTTVTRDRIRQAFDQGASLMSYIGHGGIHLWADENIFNVWDVPSLSPQSEQPIVLTMNCLNGYYHFPYFNALAEELMKADGKGAIAAFSPSGLSLNNAAHVFHRALLQELLNGGHGRLGDVVLAAQAAYAESGALPEMLAIYHLFGDPAMMIH